jgi:hypothetical protein
MFFCSSTAGDITTNAQTFSFPLPVPTAVEQSSFDARGLDGAVELAWETASELNNLGFHLYRATAEQGAYERITAALIPGLGSSPEGARYRYRDSGLENGRTYFYLLEDIETTGRTEKHGPVSATPTAENREENPDASALASMSFGDPAEVSFRVLKGGARQLVLELRTGGFSAMLQPDGSLRLSIPGFEEQTEPGAPALPVKRTWVKVDAGRAVRLRSVRVDELAVFSSLRPAAQEAPEVVATRRGTVRAGHRARREGPAFRGRGFYPEEAARLVSVGYQGEEKKALVEIHPLRWKRETGELVLARRLVVVLVQEGREPVEQAVHRESTGHADRRLLARLVAREKGLYGAPFEAIAGGAGPAAAGELARPHPSGSGGRFSRRARPWHVRPRLNAVLPERRGFTQPLWRRGGV